MRIGLLTSLALAVGASFCSLAQASSDDTCYPHWSMIKYGLDGCSNLTFLSPGNDSRVNLRLLLADQGTLPLAPNPLNEEDLNTGFGPVPFANSRLDSPPPPAVSAAPGTPVASPLDEALTKLGITRDHGENVVSLLSGEGGRCRSNDADSATTFINQLLASPELPDPERQALARGRVQMLDTCAWEPAQQASLVPAVQSAQGQAFASYLNGAISFYSGRFADAAQAFASLSDSPQPWLKETAQYMQARTALNLAQQNTFDSDGMPTKEDADPAQLKLAEEGFQHYLGTWPEGLYATSARGLLRRVYWLAGDSEKQAAEYLWQLGQAKAEQRNVTPDELVQEIDNKMLFGSGQVDQPLFQALDDLMGMRPGYGENATPKLTLEILQKQKPIFAAQPALYDYLQAAFQLYVAKNPELALKTLPTEIPAKLDYLAFSQQMLRGLALEAKQDPNGAEALWLQLLPQARQPLQREQVELALANHYERNQQVAKVFAGDSPIKTVQVRAILLRHIADAGLLRQVAQGEASTERDTALFVLLYKDLRLGHYADFAADLKQLPAEPSDTKLGASLGYTYSGGLPLKLFRWSGAKAESGYACPTIAETAATLQGDSKQPQALNCLGEFILRNSLDGMPLDSQRSKDELGGTPSLFKGATFSRLDGYQSVIADAKAPSTDKAYALFRAINCYAPSGYNSCGGKEVTPAQRKAWFKQLKTSYASTQWGKSLQYFW
ncbi:outer membrane assembly lipoprotein YfiO [Pseudomonas gingeri]|uniref:outer membrane assembly lipoprotein YfiO n=1 Tax=Pseudomonas gingeri TaxID=117681 RepID=UPI0015A445DC|nr:outer membrane assembly lipoprotein YfiO [Pseudomonas gingeri]NWA29533.1 outer membrane assembly lipoprotein YfiO [Pseudomonas gingeri]